MTDKRMSELKKTLIKNDVMGLIDNGLFLFYAIGIPIVMLIMTAIFALNTTGILRIFLIILFSVSVLASGIGMKEIVRSDAGETK